MTRDIIERVEMFAGSAVEVKRIALNESQISIYKPPPNPAKITDSRAEKYIKRFGRSSWELDALEPSVMRDLIAETIQDHIDLGIRENVIDEQGEQTERLNYIADHWDDEE